MKLSVGVLFGGTSVEHEVSVISAVQAMHALNKEKYSVTPLYFTKQGVLLTGDALLEIENYRNQKALVDACIPATVVRRGISEVAVTRAQPRRFGSNDIALLDVALPIMHGTNTEDGSIQGYLETLRLPYAGCDVASSAIGMDKMVQKQVMAAAGIPVLPAITFHTRDYVRDEEAMLDRVQQTCGYPVIVKPVNLGSSVGIRVAEHREALRGAIDFASEFSHRLLCERAVSNLREINCAVLGDYEDATPSLCEEPISGGEILSYTDKYMSEGGKSGMSGARRRLPAELSEQQERQIRQLAADAFAALGCSGVVRVDFLLDREDGSIYVNELNTIPGSLAFYLFSPMGMDYASLLDKLIELAFKRQRERSNLTFSYDTNIFDLKKTGGLKGVKGLKTL